MDRQCHIQQKSFQILQKYKYYIIGAVAGIILGLITGYTLYFEIENYLKETAPGIFSDEEKNYEGQTDITYA